MSFKMTQACIIYHSERLSRRIRAGKGVSTSFHLRSGAKIAKPGKTENSGGSDTAPQT